MSQSDISKSILAYLQENEDKKFKAAQLASTFHVSTSSMRMALAQFSKEITVESAGKTYVYFVRSDLEKQRIARKLLPVQVRERPKKDTRAMSIAMERCKELYPVGGNFKSIS